MASERGIRAGRAYVELSVHDRLQRGLRAAQAKLKAFAASVAMMGTKLFALGAAIVAPFGLGVRAAASFEKQMANVSTMLSDPGRWMGGFSKGIRQMSVEFGESTETLAQGLYDILSASVAPEKALQVLRVAAKAATAGVTDTAVAVDGITSVLNAFGLSADSAGRVADVMFATVKAGKLNFAQLASNVGKVAPMARAAGMGVEDMMAAIATMTRQGLKPEVAATRLVAILRKMPAEAKDLAAAMKKFEGKSLEQILAMVPDAEAAGGLATLAADLKGLTGDIASMRNSAGAAEEAYQKLANTASKMIDKIKQAWNEMMRTIGDAVMPMVKPWLEWAGKAVASASRWIKENSGLVQSILKIGIAVAATGAALLAFAGLVKVAAIGIGVLSAALAAALAALKISLALVIAILGAMISPITLVIAAVGALGAYIAVATGAAGKAVGWLGEKWSALAGDVATAKDGIINALKAGDIKLAAEILWTTLKLEWTKGVHTLMNIWYAFRNGFADIMDSLGPILIEVGKRIVKTLVEAAVTAVTAMWEAIKNRAEVAQIRVDFNKYRREALEKESKERDRILRETKDPAKQDKELAALRWFTQTYIDKLNAEEQGAMDEVTGVAASNFGKTLSDIWSKPLPPLNTKAFEDSINGIGLTPEQEQKLAKYRDEITKLQADFKKLTDAAKAANNAPDVPGGAAPDTPPEAPAAPDLSGVQEVLKAATEVRGTFNAMAARSLLGQQTLAERTAAATERTAGNTDKLLAEAQRGGMIFT